jgi:hypothetical protein
VADIWRIKNYRVFNNINKTNVGKILEIETCVQCEHVNLIKKTEPLKKE